MNGKLVNFVAFQAGWFASVLSAANGRPWLGVLIVSLIVAMHLKTARRAHHELKLLVLCVLMGLVFDSLLVSSGWLRYPSGMLLDGFAPYWILAMWALFSITLNSSMGWLKGSLLLSCVMGAVFGPLSYLAGQRLGAIEFIDLRSSLIALALIWALVMPVLSYAASRLDNGRKPAPMIPLQKLSGMKDA